MPTKKKLIRKPKPKPGHNKGKTYEKPLTLYYVGMEKVLERALGNGKKK
jgi:hypothetical protein